MNFSRCFPSHTPSFLACAALLFIRVVSSPAEVPTKPIIPLFDWGIFGSRLPLEDADATRFRMAGPFLESIRTTHRIGYDAFWRPLFTRADLPRRGGRSEWDFLWPLAQGKSFANETSWRFLTAFYRNLAPNGPSDNWRFSLFPLCAAGHDHLGPYAAFFPLAGHARNVLFKDDLEFFLWPLWMRSRINDVVTTDILWPIWSKTTSANGSREKFRLFPFYLHSKNTRQFEKTSILWPLWTHATYTHSNHTGTAWIAWPFLGRIHLEKQKGWMFLPPFFQFIRGEENTRTYILWPLYQRETGFRDKRYFWPLYGRRTDGPLNRQFWAWPFVFRVDNTIGRKHSTCWHVVPFYTCLTDSTRPPLPPEQAAALKAQIRRERKAAAASGDIVAIWPSASPTVLHATQDARTRLDKTLSNAPAWTISHRRVSIWPLFMRESDGPASSARFRTLDLWPGKDPPPVERAWAPIWTLADYRRNGPIRNFDLLWGLYRQASNTATGARDFSLFPLWRYIRTGGNTARHWSFLKGLLAYDRETNGTRRLRFLWLARLPLPPPHANDAPIPPPNPQTP